MTLRKLRFRQSGGFAGIVRGCEVALETLDAKGRIELERLVGESGLGEGVAGRPPGSSEALGRNRARDLVEYEIEIESDAGTARSSLTDLDLTDRTTPLIEYLQRRSKPMPLDGAG